MLAGRRFALIDLPGTYSLAPRSPDEMVTVDVLLGRRADSAGAGRGAVHRRCEQSRAESVSGEPGVGAWLADGDRAEHGRYRGAARHEDRRQPVGRAAWRSRDRGASQSAARHRSAQDGADGSDRPHAALAKESVAGRGATRSGAVGRADRTHAADDADGDAQTASEPHNGTNGHAHRAASRPIRLAAVFGRAVAAGYQRLSRKIRFAGATARFMPNSRRRGGGLPRPVAR